MKRQTRALSRLLPSAATMMIAACVGPQRQLSDPMLEIAGTTWVLRTLNGEKAPQANRRQATTVTFRREGRLTGTLSCNTVGGATAWKDDGRLIHLDEPSIITTVGCSGAAYTFGGRFWDWLEQQPRSWTRNGKKLTIDFANGKHAELVQTKSGS